MSITLVSPILVRVCAWCPPDSYPPLLCGEQYTHGMCAWHLQQQLQVLGRHRAQKRRTRRRSA